MIKTHSDDPDVEATAHRAAEIVQQVLKELPNVDTFDYGGHNLHIGEYGVCARCTAPIANAQAAGLALQHKADAEEDPVVAEHLALAARLFRLEGDIAAIRAELHNGQGSERILNELLAFTHDRQIHDSFDHSHHGGN
jgi:hypothetical protein